MVEFPQIPLPLDFLIFFKKKVTSNVRPEIYIVRHNIVSTGQTVRALKKLYSELKYNKRNFVKLILHFFSPYLFLGKICNYQKAATHSVLKIF